MLLAAWTNSKTYARSSSEFGKVSLERMRKKQLLAPHGSSLLPKKLEEVYDYIGIGRIELRKLQDRFKYAVHLSPADIHEVATKHVLTNRRLKGRRYSESSSRKTKAQFLQIAGSNGLIGAPISTKRSLWIPTRTCLTTSTCQSTL